MRITSANAFDASVLTLQRRQQQMTETQERLTSGKRVQRASDDPAAAARAERAMAALDRLDADERAMHASRGAMVLAEGALGHASELMQQVREQLVAAGNGSYTDAERRTLGEAIRGLRDDLLSVANGDDGAGRYLFGGQGADSAPLVDGTGGVTWNGAAGELKASSGERLPLAVDGRDAWLLAPDPANPGGTLGVFEVLDGIVADLLTPNRSSTAIAQGVADGLGRLDAVASNLSRWRARAGEALRRSDDIEARLNDHRLDREREKSQAVDLDMVQAISDFQSQQAGYEAVLKTYATVQRLSLLDHLG